MILPTRYKMTYNILNSKKNQEEIENSEKHINILQIIGNIGCCFVNIFLL